METETKSKAVYPDLVTWYTSGRVLKEGEKAEASDKDPVTYNIMTWVRFWRTMKEYQLPMRMSVDWGEGKDEEKTRKYYEEIFHKRCLDLIRFGKATGDFIEPIKFDEKDIITISYDEIDKIDKEDDENSSGDN